MFYLNVNPSKRVGMDGVFLGLAGLLLGISLEQPCQPSETPSIPPLLLGLTQSVQAQFGRARLEDRDLTNAAVALFHMDSVRSPHKGGVRSPHIGGVRSPHKGGVGGSHMGVVRSPTFLPRVSHLSREAAAQVGRDKNI